MDIEKIKKVFDEHMQKYDMNESHIKLKYEHSYRVMYLCKAIANDLNFKDEDLELAMVIGLLHDYARFEQWDNFKTFNDAQSIDHGNLAVEKLFVNNEIKKFDIPAQYYETIYEAIKSHNKYDYPVNILERNKLFCRLIRDADKLDIFYLISIGKIEIVDDGSEISKIIMESFFNEKLLKKENIVTNRDRLVYYLSMMYDLNFKYSYKYIKENILVEKMFGLVNKNEKLEPYFKYINKHIEEGSKQYVRKKI